MDANQTRILELLREVHTLAVKEIERLNLQILELKNQNTVVYEQPPSPVIHLPSFPDVAKRQTLMNEREVAQYMRISVAAIRRWRLFKKGPKYLKIGSSVRYRKEDIESWLKICSGPQ